MDVSGKLDPQGKRVKLSKSSLLTTGTAGIIAVYVIWLTFGLFDLHHTVHANGMRMRSFAADVHAAIAQHSDQIRASSESHTKNFTGWEFSLAIAEAKVVRMQKVEDALAEAMKEVENVLSMRDTFMSFADELVTKATEAQVALKQLDYLKQRLETERQELQQLQDEYKQQMAKVEEVINAAKEVAASSQ